LDSLPTGTGFGHLESRYGKELLQEAASEIKTLITDGTLFSDDAHVTTGMLGKRGAVIKAMCLHAAHDCNMSCEYCFAGKGSFTGEKSLLDVGTGKRAIDFLLRHSSGRKNLEVDFFGGEPLMNFDTIKAIVTYGREEERKHGKNIRFTVTTNGLLLDEAKEAFINENMDNVILSIDGRPEINDAARKTVGGQGTYGHIIKNFNRFRERRKGNYFLRGTFTNNNLDFSDDVKHLVDLGFHAVSVEPVVADETKAYALKPDDIPRIKDEYDRLADLCVSYAEAGKPFVFFHFNIDLEQGPCVIKRVSGCGAGTEYVAVAPDGDIYPCHQFVGEEQFRLGNVNDAVFENRLYDMFNGAHMMNKPECGACWAKYYCGGGCHANAWHINQDILKPYALGCEMERKRVECAIGIKAMLFLRRSGENGL
jgi:uncharacterized protein